MPRRKKTRAEKILSEPYRHSVPPTDIRVERLLSKCLVVEHGRGRYSIMLADLTVGTYRYVKSRRERHGYPRKVERVERFHCDEYPRTWHDDEGECQREVAAQFLTKADVYAAATAHTLSGSYFG